LALIVPSGGSSGLPKVPAFAADTVMAAPMADTANNSRLENIFCCSFNAQERGSCQGL
jgi:hypothetical protein